jgi:hypothetical protein
VYTDWVLYKTSEWGNCEQGTKVRTLFYKRTGKMVCPAGTNCVDPCPPQYKEETETAQCGGCEVATSTAEQGFSLPNSKPATETSWVNSNVTGGPWEFLFKQDNGFGHNSCYPSGFLAAVVLVKAGQTYQYYLNVLPGQVLCSYDPPGSGKPKDISHVSYFICED